MAWTRAFPFCSPSRAASPRLAMLFGSLFFASIPALAAADPQQARLSEDAAQVLVAEYRELRLQCAEQTGEQQRACFRELHANLASYRLAKQRLKQADTPDPHNIHLVSF